MENRTLLATVPVTLEFPAEMKGSIQEVLAGEYESGYSGENLTVLDIGANIGSFAIWAAWRWPNSRIQCYEPHPGTFRMLMKNVAAFPNITPVNAAVWPGEKQRKLFQTRYDGDGESGLVACLNETFEAAAQDHVFEVTTLHPRALPPGDVIRQTPKAPKPRFLSISISAVFR